MNRIVLKLLLVVIICGSVNAQTTDKFLIGGLFGFNSATMSCSESAVNDYIGSILLPYYGVFTEYNFGGDTSLSPFTLREEVRLIGRGAQWNIPKQTAVNSGPAYVDISLPLLIYWRTDVVSPYLLVAPNLEIHYGWFTSSNGNWVKLNDMKPIDFSVSIGAGLKFKAASFGGMKNVYVGIEGRYTLGLLNVVDAAKSPETYKHRGIEFGITASYPLITYTAQKSGSSREYTDTVVVYDPNVDKEVVTFEGRDVNVSGNDTITTNTYIKKVPIGDPCKDLSITTLKRIADQIPIITMDEFRKANLNDICCVKLIFNDNNNNTNDANNVWTDVHSPSLTKNGERLLSEVASILKSKTSYNDVELFIVGHCDSSGEFRSSFDTSTQAGKDLAFQYVSNYPTNKKPFNNPELSTKRSKTTQDWLFENGLDKYKMTLAGYSCQIPRKDIRYGWENRGMRFGDRRVEIIIRCRKR